MLNLINNQDEQQQFLASHNNPFKTDKIDIITFNIRRRHFSPSEIVHEASVYFKNGTTSVSHDIEADDFPSLVQKVQAFINSLD
jgi:hypothetical protein